MPVRSPVDSFAVSAIGLDEQSPFVKQLPVLGLFAVAVLISLLVPTIVVSSPTALIVASIFIVMTTGIAAILTRFNASGPILLLVPGLDFVAVGVLRFATGESASIFASLAILPVVWVAAFDGRRHIVYAFLGVVIGLVIPFALGSTLEENPNEIARGFFSALAFGLAAAVVNDLARLARDRVADVHAREQLNLVELEQASAVQQALLPKPVSGASDYAFAGVCVPSRTIGGDFFDWYEITGGMAFTVGDVMGKGIGAGIIAATVRAVVRSARNHEDLSVALARASECLESDLGDTAAFATLFHARLDASSGIVRYADAGHGLSLHVSADGTWRRLASRNLPVGIPADEPWGSAELQLQPGDALVSCSDGILDLYDGSVESLRHIAALTAEASDASQIIARIRELAVASDASADDDVTVLVVKRTAN
ncbi:PP2C family protein-serine/threonine phosphatase [Microbacterium sp.]|uniref:PP2C family protein-serine/threonine phosphatase n=1 Tax=Microbacterium sp. TaxID=51671 RepID=UPI002E36AD4E|nr:SpoIIE family protein phosphatase [Microbacterium sp.]HEX5729977.1 SpoIIE family protein phosphatase [Microbacterium sp.]